MKKISLLIVLSFIFLNSYAQKADSLSHWKKSCLTSLTFSQVALSNWAKGGVNSFSANLLLKLNANYKKDKLSWENGFEFSYGILKEGESVARKSDDNLEFTSKAGYQISKKWYASLLFNFKSQLTEGFDYAADPELAISKFLAPAYIKLSLGMDYKPNDKFSALLSPLTGKLTLVTDDRLSAAGAFGVAAGETSKFEVGAYVKFELKTPIVKNVNLNTKLDLFSSYTKKPENIDVNWKVLIDMKINKFLSANLHGELIYDDDIMITDSEGKIGPRLQIKEVFGLGLSYKF